MKIQVTLIQDSSIFFNKEESLKKLKKLVTEHAHDSDLILFPESFIPGYPRGFSFGTQVGSRSKEGRNLYQDYYQNSIDLDSREANELEKLARETHTYLVIGITEKNSINGSLYCSMMYLSPTKGLLGVHRKIKPTGQERVVWSEAGGESLVSFNSRIGRLGGLICWENYMPLARQAMYNKGVQIYLAPTADFRNTWIPTLQHIALEGRCFVLGCNQYFTKSMYPDKYKNQCMIENEEICPGGSVIISPLGEIISGPLFDTSGAVKATIDLDEIVKSKLDFDPAGHYTRPDIFTLNVKNQPKTRQE